MATALETLIDFLDLDIDEADEVLAAGLKADLDMDRISAGHAGIPFGHRAKAGDEVLLREGERTNWFVAYAVINGSVYVSAAHVEDLDLNI